jgi:hypothetical protein
VVRVTVFVIFSHLFVHHVAVGTAAAPPRSTTTRWRPVIDNNSLVLVAAILEGIAGKRTNGSDTG